MVSTAVSPPGIVRAALMAFAIPKSLTTAELPARKMSTCA